MGKKEIDKHTNNSTQELIKPKEPKVKQNPDQK